MWDTVRPILSDWLYPPRPGRAIARMGEIDRSEPIEVRRVFWSLELKKRGYVEMAKIVSDAGSVVAVVDRSLSMRLPSLFCAIFASDSLLLS